MTTLHLRNPTGRSPLRLGLPRAHPIWIIRGFFLIPLALAWFGLSPESRAVSPAPDGGYPGNNTAEGTNALFSLTTGFQNTAIGSSALSRNTTGYGNTANGFDALYHNTTGGNNTANGPDSLFSNTTGFANTANGPGALYSNTTGSSNTADGFKALYSNTTGTYNTANGLEALFSNTTGNYNTATGPLALYHNTTGLQNTATGVNALISNTTGGYNTANGVNTLYHNTGSNNIGLGYGAGSSLTTGSNNIVIGNGGVTGDANKIRIGTVGTQNGTFIAGIHGVTVASAVGVVIDVNGHIGTVTSSARFKEAIKPMDKASEAILALKPVTFRYKKELDPDGIPQFGLIAEQVERVNPDLVARDAKGEIYTVRYEAVNAMLLNEFLKQRNEFLEEQRTVQEQQKQISALRSELREQRALIQKVNDKMELNRPAPQMAGGHQ